MLWDIFWILNVFQQNWNLSRIDSVRIFWSSQTHYQFHQGRHPSSNACLCQSIQGRSSESKGSKAASPHEDLSYTLTQCGPHHRQFWWTQTESKGTRLIQFLFARGGQAKCFGICSHMRILGAFGLCNVAMNCTAPDTGNMEVLEKFGTEEQKQRWLVPLLEGKIRSAYAMTEPEWQAVMPPTSVPPSQGMEMSMWLMAINGTSVVLVVLSAKSLFFWEGLEHLIEKHKQHSMILVPRDAEGVHIIRPLAVFGHIHDHAEILFENVRVPVSNMLLGEGRGFEIAQGRLGPGRIHHCMRTIGTAEQALDAILHRVHQRVAFGSSWQIKQPSVNDCRSTDGHHQITASMLPGCCTGRWSWF